MPSTVPFTLDASILPYAANLLVYTNDANEVVIVWTGLDPSATVSQLVFTAKLNPADADNAPTTVQKIATAASGLLTNPGPGVWQGVFPLTAADETTLLAQHSYDIKGYGSFGAQPRAIQTGTIKTAVGITSLTTVLVAVASVTIAPSPALLFTGQQLPLGVTVLDAAGDQLLGLPVQWASSNTSIATVDNNGLVTGQTNGSCTITATVNGVAQSVTVQVSGLVYTP